MTLGKLSMWLLPSPASFLLRFRYKNQPRVLIGVGRFLGQGEINDTRTTEQFVQPAVAVAPPHRGKDQQRPQGSPTVRQKSASPMVACKSPVSDPRKRSR